MSEEYEKPGMVNWYDPRQLKDTGKRTLISTIIGENADPRLVASLASSGKLFDYSKELVKDKDDFKTGEKPRDEIWIDYVSDVGDGFNPTYAVAYGLAKENLKIPDLAKTLKRGDVLVFGGDGVYPTANSEEYEKRLITPYKMAFKANPKTPATKINKSDEVDLNEEPHVFALPGNHDWYDSLVAFQQVFSTHIFNRRIFADAWRTRQELSYFALKLPHNWWLFGVDLQLSHNIDVPQLQYFEKVVNQMKAGDKIILCVPEPYWVKAIKYQGITDVFEKKEESIEKLESILKEKDLEIKLYLAGDLHHYRRFESDDDKRINKITAGGGGAFLHPTHDFDFEENKVKRKENDKTTKYFSLKKNYPSFKESRKHDWKNLYQFIPKNKTFGFLTAGIYIILAFLTNAEVTEFTWRNAFRATIQSVIREPLALFVIVLLLLGLIFFTDSNSKIYRRTAGFIHGLFHLGAIFVLGWIAYRLSEWLIAANYLPEAYNSLVWFFSVLLVCGLGGYLIGSFIMGLYLFVSLHFFGRHDNEAFSALKIEDYKNFVRLHIDKEGKLTIYPLKIEKVPRNWTPVKKGDEIVSYKPKEKLEPKLIEKIEPIG